MQGTADILLSQDFLPVLISYVFTPSFTTSSD
jgi:hypothetical protein